MKSKEELIKEREEIRKKHSLSAILNKQSEGLGDSIAKMTSALGIKPCGACKKRQEKLNQIFPYKK